VQENKKYFTQRKTIGRKENKKNEISFERIEKIFFSKVNYSNVFFHIFPSSLFAKYFSPPFFFLPFFRARKAIARTKSSDENCSPTQQKKAKGKKKPKRYATKEPKRNEKSLQASNKQQSQRKQKKIRKKKSCRKDLVCVQDKTQHNP